MKCGYTAISILITIALTLCLSPAGPYASVANGVSPASEGRVLATAADTAGREDPLSHPDEPSHRPSINPPGEASINPPDETSVEVRAFRFLNRAPANRILDAIMPIITDLKRWRVVLLVVWSLLVLFGGTRGRWAALMLIPLIAASDQISSHLLKPLVQRMRPCEVLGNVHLWYGPEGWLTTPASVVRSYKSSFSFPSSHAANITASMLFLGLAYRRLIVPLIVIAVAVSYSRIYIGVHWPSDVLVGMALGGLLAWPAYFAYKRLNGNNPARSAPGTTAA